MSTKSFSERPRFVTQQTKTTFFPASSLHGVVQTSEYSSAVSLSSSRTGENNPKWRSQVSRGLNATVDLSGTRQKLKYSPASYNMVTLSNVTGRVVYDAMYVPSFNSLGNISAISSSYADSMASLLFYKNARNALTHFRSYSFFGELTEALHMIRNPAKILRLSIPKLIGKLRKRVKGIRGNLLDKPFKARKIWGETWLEYAFGWRPLINDVASGAEAIAELSLVQPPFKMVRSSFKDDSSRTSSTSTVSINSGQIGQQVSCTTGSAIVKYYGVIWTNDGEFLPGVPRVLGLRGEDIPDAVWELTPWSFLIDYFVNVGDVISAYSFNKANLAWVSRSIVKQSVIHKDVSTSQAYQIENGNLGSGTSVISVGGGVSKSETVNSSVVRTKSAILRSPEFHWKIPGLGLKWLNIAALWAARRANPRP